MNEQELNKKLAEWAGFSYTMHYVPCVGHTEEDDPDPMYLELWVNPSKELIDLHWDFGHSVFEPNFTQSSDSCFKWLVPKLQGLNKPYSVGVHLDCMAEGYTWCASLTTVKTPISKNRDVLGMRYGVEGSAKTPALALCLAIEKLIDEGE